MGRRRRRRLDAEERRLWERVAASADPLRPSPLRTGAPLEAQSTALFAPPLSSPRPEQQPDQPRATQPHVPAPPEQRRTLRPTGTPGTTARVRWAAPDARPVGRPEAGLDGRTAERLRKGARDPDARIDLHGMTADRAHGACLHFLAAAASRGDRVVLVITGKGGRDRNGFVTGSGVLRDSLPGWLRSSPLGHSIVGIYQAHRRHGGEGAFYVYLKRRR